VPDSTRNIKARRPILTATKKPGMATRCHGRAVGRKKTTPNANNRSPK